MIWVIFYFFSLSNEENNTLLRLLVVLLVKNPPANAGDSRDMDSIPGLGRFPGGGHGKPFQYSCLENPNGQRSLVGYGP